MKRIEIIKNAIEKKDHKNIKFKKNDAKLLVGLSEQFLDEKKYNLLIKTMVFFNYMWSDSISSVWKLSMGKNKMNLLENDDGNSFDSKEISRAGEIITKIHIKLIRELFEKKEF